MMNNDSLRVSFNEMIELHDHTLAQRDALAELCLDFVCKCQLFGEDWTEENLVCSAGDVIEKLQAHNFYYVNNKIDSYYNGTKK